MLGKLVEEKMTELPSTADRNFLWQYLKDEGNPER
jgi:hypothetical protein